MNIYDRVNIKMLSIDNLPIRKNAPQYTIYYNRPQKSKKRCLICVDSFTNGKILHTMATQHKAIKEQVCEYFIDLEHGTIRKLKEHVRYCTNHNIKLVLNKDNYYKGTKSMALKKLNNLLKSI